MRLNLIYCDFNYKLFRRIKLKNKVFYKIAVLTLSIVLIACSGGMDEAGCPEINDRRINVVATTPMIGEFVSQVGGNNINLTVLMPSEADPHTYDPAPQDAGKIADADLVFYTGLKYEPAALIKLLENSACDTEVLSEVGQNVYPIETDEEEEGHEGHDHGAYDPHFWFDPNRVAYAAEYIEGKLSEFDSNNASEYQVATDVFVNDLKDLSRQVSELISSVPSQNRKLITTHESLGYLEAKYGLEILSTIIPSLTSANEIAPSDLVEVIDTIEDNNVKVIFIEAEAPSVYAETIVAETNIKPVTGLWVETLKENQSYADFLISNVKLITDSLKDLD